jgi:hypothetical protein
VKKTRLVQKKKHIAIGLSFILVFLVAVHLFLNADTDPASENRPVVVLEKPETGSQEDRMALQEQAPPGADKKKSFGDKTVIFADKNEAVVDKPVAVADRPAPVSDLPGTEDKKPRAVGGNVLTAPEKHLTAQDDVRIAEGLPGQSGAAGQSKLVQKPIQKPPDINYQDLKTGSHLDQIMEKRLQAAGINESLDMIVRADESFTVGGKTVSMTDILEKAAAGKQKIFEKRITEFEETAPESLNEYGIYVVQPGDNIWNIHFNILKEFYASRGIHVARDADEPLDTGHSSGVGKILKFSEIMVIIYNLMEEEIVMNIDLIEPLSKIVIYNMGDVFSLLSDIRFDQIDQIQFDGRTLWIPARKT